MEINYFGPCSTCEYFRSIKTNRVLMLVPNVLEPSTAPIHNESFPSCPTCSFSHPLTFFWLAFVLACKFSVQSLKLSVSHHWQSKCRACRVAVQPKHLDKWKSRPSLVQLLSGKLNFLPEDQYGSCHVIIPSSWDWNRVGENYYERLI